MKNIVPLILLLLTATSAQAESSSEKKAQEPTSRWSSLPTEIFQPLVAGVREPQFSIRRERNTGDLDFNAGVVSFGDYLPFVGYEFENSSKLQLGIDGSLFAIYNLEKDSYDLFNTDYHVAITTAYAKDSFSARFRVLHVSSHLGDEFLLENPDFVRKNSSYEEFQLAFAWATGNWRPYVGSGAIFHSNSLGNLEPWSVKGGVEYRTPAFRGLEWLVAGELITSQRTDWNLTRSALAGLVVLKNETKEVRLMLSYFGGNSPQGQFFRDRIEYFGFGIYLLV